VVKNKSYPKKCENKHVALAHSVIRFYDDDDDDGGKSTPGVYEKSERPDEEIQPCKKRKSAFLIN